MVDQDMESVGNGLVNRRNVLKSAVAVGIVGSLSGCSGLGNGGGGNGGGSADEDVEDLPEESATIGFIGPNNPVLGWPMGARTFKKHMETISDGKFTVEIAPDGQLGGNSEMLEATIGGDLEIIGFATQGNMARFMADWSVMSYPYMFGNKEVAQYVTTSSDWAADFRERVRNELGLKVLYQFDNPGGLRHFTANTQLKSIDDFNGLKFRTLDNPAIIELIESLGGSPEIVSGSEVYNALDQGVVDGQENPIGIATIFYNVHEVQSFMLLDGHTLSQANSFCNNEWFNNLHPTYQRHVEVAAEKAEIMARSANNILDERAATILREGGMEIHNPSQEFRNNLRNAAQANVEEVLRDRMNNPELLDSMIETYEEAAEMFKVA